MSLELNCRVFVSWIWKRKKLSYPREHSRVIIYLDDDLTLVQVIFHMENMAQILIVSKEGKWVVYVWPLAYSRFAPLGISPYLCICDGLIRFCYYGDIVLLDDFNARTKDDG